MGVGGAQTDTGFPPPQQRPTVAQWGSGPECHSRISVTPVPKGLDRETEASGAAHLFTATCVMFPQLL